MANELATINSMRACLNSPSFLTQIKTAVRTTIAPETVARIALTALQRNPDLQNCTQHSFLGALLTACQMGLEPDNVTGQAYLVPYGKVCTLIPGYRGLIQLAYRSEMVRSIISRNVFKNEPHSLDLSGSPCVVGHISLPPSKRGEYVGSYAIAHLTNGGIVSEWMWSEEVFKVRDRSPASKSRMSPWTHADDQWEMCRKTVVRRLAKYMPSSPEFRRAVAMEDQADAGERQDFIDVDIAEEPKAAPSRAERIKHQAEAVTPPKEIAPPAESAAAETHPTQAETASETAAGPQEDDAPKLDNDGAKKLAAKIAALSGEDRKKLLAQYNIGATAVVGGIHRLSGKDQQSLADEVASAQ